MSLELVKETVRINQPIGEESGRTIVENDIIVPDVKPDIARILLLDGDAFINGAEAASDELIINGTIRYKILYVSDDPDQPVKSINTTSDFTYPMNIPNVRQGMNCRVKCGIEHMEYEILNSRKINVKTIVSLYGRAANRLEQYITREFEGLEDIQILRNSVFINSYAGDSETTCTVSETLELPAGKPAIREILRNDVKITGKEFKPGDGKIVANGEINVSTLYIGDDETHSIQYMEHEIPFSHLIDLPDVNENSSCNMEFEIGELSFEPEEDADGELRMMKGEIMLNVYAEAFGSREIELVEDAYSPNTGINLEKEELRMEELAAESKSQATIKETINIQEDSPEISEVFNVLGRVSLSGSEIMDDRVSVEGAVECDILYLANNEEQPIFCITREIPFKQVFEMKGVKPSMRLDLDTDIEQCSYSMLSAREVEVRFVVGLAGRAVSQVAIPVIVKADEQPFDDKRLESRPSITIYFTQPGDTLWRIAKKYSTTVNEVKKNNDIDDSGIIEAGSQILIPGKIG